MSEGRQMEQVGDCLPRSMTRTCFGADRIRLIRLYVFYHSGSEKPPTFAHLNFPMTLFNTLGLNQPLLDAIDALGFTEATPIQAETIPALLADEGKRDMIALAQTGTGKTAAFGLPILQILDSQRGAEPKKPSVLIYLQLVSYVFKSRERWKSMPQICAISAFSRSTVAPAFGRSKPPCARELTSLWLRLGV
jgi:hypothetical protein